VGFTNDFIPDCPFKLFLAVQILTPLLSQTVPNFLVFFPGYLIVNLMKIPKICLKQQYSYFKCVLQMVLFLIVFSNCVSDSSNFDTAFLPDCIKFCSIFSGYLIGNLMGISKMCLK